MDHFNSNLWEATPYGLLGFSLHVGMMFLALVRVIVCHHVHHSDFVGDLLGRVRIFPNN